VLDPSHTRSPFPAPLLIQEMRTRGFSPWHTDRPIPRPLPPTYNDVGGDVGGGVIGFGRGRLVPVLVRVAIERDVLEMEVAE